MFQDLATQLQEKIAELAGQRGVPGYVAGVYQGGAQVVVAHGTANVATGEPMAEDTGFLVGSITKVLTTTLVMRAVERGEIDLEERVVSYLPEFTLAAPQEAAEIRVRNLLNHTDGIDGDLYFPIAWGRDALHGYVEGLARCGTLFKPGEYVSYSNPAFNVAGRLLEIVTGEWYHDLLEHELYGPIGMTGSSTSAEQAILNRTAVGHFPGPNGPQRTDTFMLPESWSACGSTPIVTIGDLLAFARTHLAMGVAPTGERVLSAESAERMRTATFDLGTPNVAPIGLGWWLLPFGEAVALWHGGGSPGGSSHLVAFPEHDFAFAGFGNLAGAGGLHDPLTQWVLEEYAGIDVPDFVSSTVDAGDLSRFEGSYRSHQLRVDVTAVEGQLEQTFVFEPLDDEQRGILERFSGGNFPPPPQRLVAVGDGLFAAADAPPDSLKGLGRMFMVAFHGDVNGHAAHRSQGGRLPRWDGRA
jgi:CubicO group peptidase (beta-lactamase class C family)